ncbi:hypothetical protein F4819DRAFT_256592 [Hypoxylon fuscum]|nr:hypothetical protein F4819DRAFT_256592 [Hypoxylon fuscum]
MGDNTPLLDQDTSDAGDGNQQRGSTQNWTWNWRPAYHRAQVATSRFINSRTKHWLVLVLIILDVAGIMSDLFIALITCELGVEHDEWVEPTRNALTIFSLSLSCVFLAELFLSVFADGWGYFASWLHCFDALVVVVGFAIDLFEHNTVEVIASLVVMLRLWRFVKIVDEFSVEASEQTEELRMRIQGLEMRNATLEAQLEQRR